MTSKNLKAESLHDLKLSNDSQSIIYDIDIWYYLFLSAIAFHYQVSNQI